MPPAAGAANKECLGALDTVRGCFLPNVCGCLRELSDQDASADELSDGWDSSSCRWSVKSVSIEYLGCLDTVRVCLCGSMMCS